MAGWGGGINRIDVLVKPHGRVTNMCYCYIFRHFANLAGFHADRFASLKAKEVATCAPLHE